MIQRKPQLALLAALATIVFTSAAACGQGSGPGDERKSLSIAALRQGIAETKIALSQLPQRLIRETGGTLGHRTHRSNLAENTPWVEVDLGELLEFDLIALIPMTSIDENQKSTDFGFPLRYQITLFDSPAGTKGRILFDSIDSPESTEPNQSPVLIRCPATSARRIRITALKTARDPIENQSVFALAELLIFNAGRNLAIGKPVTATFTQSYRPIYDPSYVTDGFMPFSHPQTSKKVRTNYFLIRQVDPAVPVSVTLDLGKPTPIDEVRLYPVHLGNNFSIFHRTGLGFPRRFSIETSNEEALTNAETIFQTGESDYPPPGHRLAIFAGIGKTGRFVRITANELPQDPHRATPVLAFAEIEVISNGRPVSHNANVSIMPDGLEVSDSSERLVDGLSSHGEIPPLRDWLLQLSDRNSLEQQLVRFEQELVQKNIQQGDLLRRIFWGVSIAIPLFGLVVSWQRFMRFRQLSRLREDLAADLHDEIGGNFSGIALLCDQLISDDELPNTYLESLNSIASISRESADNTRSLVYFLESQNVKGELIAKMESTAAVLLAGVPYRFEITGANYLQKLTPKEKWHLLLFFKEAVTNVAKHSGATQAVLCINVTPHWLELSISDNGKWMKDFVVLPAHLKIRAQKLHGSTTIESTDSGTKIAIRRSI